jgi:hypothetical protein
VPVGIPVAGLTDAFDANRSAPSRLRELRPRPHGGRRSRPANFYACSIVAPSSRKLRALDTEDQPLDLAAGAFVSSRRETETRRA